MEQLEQSNAHGKSVTQNGTGNYDKKIVTSNNSSNSVTAKAELTHTKHKDEFIDLFKSIVFGNEGMLLNDEIFTISPNDTFEHFADIIDNQIELKKKEISQLSATKEYLHFFSIIFILNKLKVVCFMELKRLLALNHNEQLYRLLNFLLQRQVVRMAYLSTDREILNIIDLKTQINPKQTSYYELCPDFKSNIDGKTDRLQKLIPLHITQEVVQQEIFYQDKEKELEKLRYDEALKNKQFVNKHQSEFWRIDSFCVENFKVGETFSYPELIKTMTFFNKIISSERRARKHLEYLISIDYFGQIDLDGKMLLKYNGLDNVRIRKAERYRT